MQILTFQQACDYLQIGRNTMYKLLESGELKGFRIGKLWRFSLREIEQYVERPTSQTHLISKKAYMG